MNFNRNTGRIASIFAAAALIAAAAVPASAMADPDAQQPAAKQAEKPKLSRAARNMIWCVAPANGGPDAKKVCKTRGQWIDEGKDPFAK